MRLKSNFSGTTALRRSQSVDPSGAKAFRPSDAESLNSTQRQFEYFVNIDRDMAIAEDEQDLMSFNVNRAVDPSGANAENTGDEVVEELQLHDDDNDGLVNRKRHPNNNFSTKLEAIAYANKYSVNSASKKFKVDRKVIRDWKKKEVEIEQLINVSGTKRKRLNGGGRPVLYPDIDLELAEWIRQMRENKREVSRRIINLNAARIFHGTNIKISNGWLEKFLKRHDFVLRRRTTTCQKAPENYCEAICKFIVHVEQRRKQENFSSIYAMDETAVWFDCPDNRCIETRRAKDVTVVTTGHEKMRVTVCLSARSDGKKLPPYVLVKRKRPVTAIVDQFKGKLIINWAGSAWMNDSSTEDYLRQVIKAGGVFSGKRLLVWDAFASHKSERTLEVLKELNIDAVFIPGGCTKSIQAPDVSWNKAFKEKFVSFILSG